MRQLASLAATLVMAVACATAAAQDPSAGAPSQNPNPNSAESRMSALEASLTRQARDMADLEKASKKSIFDRLLPVLTFIGGFLLSQLQRFRDLARERTNLRFVLSREVKEIYGSLNQLVDPKSKDDHPSIMHLVALHGSKLSTKVYDDYFSKISILKPHFVELLYDTYSKITKHIENCSEFQEILSGDTEPNRSEVAAKATVALGSLRPAFEKAQELLRQFPDGEAIIAEFANESGEAITKFHELSKLLKQDWDNKQVDANREPVSSSEPRQEEEPKQIPPGSPSAPDGSP